MSGNTGAMEGVVGDRDCRQLSMPVAPPPTRAKNAKHFLFVGIGLGIVALISVSTTPIHQLFMAGGPFFPMMTRELFAPHFAGREHVSRFGSALPYFSSPENVHVTKTLPQARAPIVRGGLVVFGRHVGR
jgi:hypothetical protein